MATFTELVQQLDESKKRIESLQQQLAEEQSKAKDLFAEFQKAQSEMAAMIGISLPAVEAKKAKGKRNLTAEGKLNIQVGAALRKWKREHPQATEKQIKSQKEKFVAELKA